MNRVMTEAQGHALKSAFRHGVRLAGGVEAFSGVTRISPAQISRCGNPGMPDFPALDVALEADLEAGQPAIAAALAAAQGYGLCRLSPPGGGGAHAPGGGASAAPPGMEDAVCLVDQATQSFRVMREALADGRLTPLERARIREKLRDMLLVIVEMEGRL